MPVPTEYMASAGISKDENNLWGLWTKANLIFIK